MYAILCIFSFFFLLSFDPVVDAFFVCLIFFKTGNLRRLFGICSIARTALLFKLELNGGASEEENNKALIWCRPGSKQNTRISFISLASE
jgi:hypothetical protein